MNCPTPLSGLLYPYITNPNIIAADNANIVHRAAAIAPPGGAVTDTNNYYITNI